MQTCDELSVTDGVNELKDDLKDMVDRWRQINKFYQDRVGQVAEAKKNVKKYRGLLFPLENEVKKAEMTLESFDHRGIDVERGKKDLQALEVRTSAFEMSSVEMRVRS